jgi:hypothetical protein
VLLPTGGCTKFSKKKQKTRRYYLVSLVFLIDEAILLLKEGTMGIAFLVSRRGEVLVFPERISDQVHKKF